MQTVWNIVSLNLKTFACQWGRIAALLLSMACLGLAAGFAGSFFLTGTNFIGPIPVAIVDLDESIETRMIVSAIADAPEHGDLLEFSLKSRQDAASALTAGGVTAVITLPENFGSAMTGGQNIPFGVEYNLDRPLASALVRVVADSFADMLRSSQTGVYVTLNYAAMQEISPEVYNAIFMGINFHFLGLVLNRADMFIHEYLSISGGLAIWQAYFIAAYITLMMCAAFIMTDAVRRNFSRHFVRRLAINGISPRQVFLACAISYFLLFIVQNFGFWLCVELLSAVFGIPAVGLSLSLVWSLAVVAAVLATFAAMLTFAFSGALPAGVFTAVFVGVSLFLSGGIVPVEYFSQGLRLASNVVFNTWGSRLISASITGGSLAVPTLVCCAFALLFSAIGCAAAGQRGRLL